MIATKLTEPAYEEVWDWVYEQLSFAPSIQPEHWPSIITAQPSAKFSIHFLWDRPMEEQDQQLHNDFVAKAIKTFRDITREEETIYALDWQHDAYFYDAHTLTVGFMQGREVKGHVISFIPDGDYHIFMTKDRENIWFGHPWEETITLIGDKLIIAAMQNGLLSVED